MAVEILSITEGCFLLLSAMTINTIVIWLVLFALPRRRMADLDTLLAATQTLLEDGVEECLLPNSRTLFHKRFWECVRCRSSNMIFILIFSCVRSILRKEAALVRSKVRKCRNICQEFGQWNAGLSTDISALHSQLKDLFDEISVCSTIHHAVFAVLMHISGTMLQRSP